MNDWSIPLQVSETPSTFARKRKVQMCVTLYAEVYLTDAVVDLVKQDHYSGVSVAIFGPMHPSNPKPGDPYLPKRRDRTA